MLKLRVPTSVQADRATFEVPYGHLERGEHGDEQWRRRGSTCPTAARALGRERLEVRPGVQGGDIGITAARSPVYAWHHPRELDDPTGRYEYLDQGRQEFAYRLVPHAGDWRDAGPCTSRRSSTPPFTLIESYHSASCRRTARSCRTEAATWS